MSLLGEHTAVISLGVSCQTSWQIGQHRELLCSLLGDSLVPAGLPFDWIAAGAGGLPALLAEPLWFPSARHELVPPYAYWPRLDVHFWHEAERPEDLPDAARFAAAQSKAAYLRARFLALATLRRRIFVMSNTQNNLEWMASLSGRLHPRFTRARLEATRTAISVRFPGCNEFLFVTRPDRADPDVLGDPFVAVLTPDATDWMGDDAQWADVLRGFLPALARGQVGEVRCSSRSRP